MRLKTITLAILFAQSGFAAFESADFNGQKRLKITYVTPSGKDVPAERQIVFQSAIGC